MFFKRAELECASAPDGQATISVPAADSTKKSGRVDNILLQSPLYRFKRDVLSLVAKMNQGVPNPDCEVLKKQTMFIQSQLLHALTNDPSMPGSFKIILMDYHAKSVRATLVDRRGEHARDSIEK